jgi:hypothetical protein
VTVLPASEPIFSEMATEIAVVDESGGEFVEVRQQGRTDIGKIIIEPSEWKMLRAAIDRMVGECREVGGSDTATHNA